MKNIGILGGTFDPPHLGHLIIADQVLNELKLDEIWFMPNHVPPHKEKVSNTSDEDRIMMLEYTIQGHFRFKIEPIEIERSGKSYTYDTMVLLKERYPDYNFYFIIGADMVEYLPKWYKINELLSLVQFVGVNRPGYSVKQSLPVSLVDTPMIDISSTFIRNQIKSGKSVKYFVTDSVLQYIEEKGLYGSK